MTSDSVHCTSLELFASQYSTEGQIKEPNLLMEAGQSLLGAASSYTRGDIGGAVQSVAGFVRGATAGRSAQQRSRQIKTSPADVVRRFLLLSFRWLKLHIDIMEWVQRLSDKCRCCGGWCRYWRHELCKRHVHALYS